MTEPRRDSVLLVHWHDLGRYLGVHGHPDVSSPRLDQLAARTAGRPANRRVGRSLSRRCGQGGSSHLRSQFTRATAKILRNGKNVVPSGRAG